MKVVLSTNGPLHLIKSAEYLSKLVDLRVIQGWIPNKRSRVLLSIASKIVGRNLEKSLQKRSPAVLEGNNYAVSVPEFIYWFGRYFLKMDLSTEAGRLFGLLSKKYINDVDVLHVRSGSGFSAIKKARNKGVKIIVDHSIAHPGYMDRQLREEFEKQGLKFELGMDSTFWRAVIEDCKCADILLVNSQFVRKTFVEFGYDEKKIAVVTQGVRDDFFSLKKDYSKEKKIKILFTGSFGFRKGGEYILSAMKKLDEIGFSYEMFIVGSYAGSEELIRKYKSDNVKFVGHVVQNELKEFLKKADIYLFPSLSEGCASSAMEAMAAGLPVVVTEETGLPVENDIDGIIIPSKSTDEIVRAVIRLSEDSAKRKYLGINAAQKIQKDFTWERYAEQVVEVYKSVLK